MTTLLNHSALISLPVAQNLATVSASFHKHRYKFLRYLLERIIYLRSLLDWNVMRDWGSIPSSGNMFLSSIQRSDRLWGPSSFLTNGYRGVFPKDKDDHSLHHVSRLRGCRTIFSNPKCVFMKWYLFKQGEPLPWLYYRKAGLNSGAVLVFSWSPRKITIHLCEGNQCTSRMRIGHKPVSLPLKSTWSENENCNLNLGEENSRKQTAWMTYL